VASLFSAQNIWFSPAVNPTWLGHRLRKCVGFTVPLAPLFQTRNKQNVCSRCPPMPPSQGPPAAPLAHPARQHRLHSPRRGRAGAAARAERELPRCRAGAAASPRLGERSLPRNGRIRPHLGFTSKCHGGVRDKSKITVFTNI